MWFVFAVILAVLAVLATNRWRYDLTGMTGLLALALTGVITPDEALAGFSHPAVVSVAAVLVISEALQSSRAADLIGNLITRIRQPGLQVPALVALVTAISAFMNDTGALAAVMPAALRAAREMKVAASRLLMPIAFASLLGGMITAVGTPANLIIAALRAEAVGRPFAIFDFTYVGLPIALAGGLFLGLVGWRWAPSRRGSAEQPDLFDIRDYLTEVHVTAHSILAGQPLAYLGRAVDAEVTVVALVRDDQVRQLPPPYEVLRPGDLLVVEADSEALSRFLDQARVELAPQKDVERILRGGPVELMEAVVRPGSALIDRTVRDLNLRWRYGVNLLAVSHFGARPATRVASVRFQPGDILLLQGTQASLRGAAASLGLLPLPERGLRLRAGAPAALSIAVFLAAIAATVTGVVPFVIAFVTAALAMVMLGIVPARRAYAAIDWQVIVLLAAMLPYGTALEKTGGAAYLAGLLRAAAAHSPPWAVVGLLLAATVALTNLIGAKPAAVLSGSVALHAAAALGLAPDPLLMAVAVGASCAFLTPVGHQVNVIVLGPGGYRFGDFLRLGLPLTAITCLLAVALILRVWPLHS